MDVRKLLFERRLVDSVFMANEEITLIDFRLQVTIIMLKYQLHYSSWEHFERCI